MQGATPEQLDAYFAGGTYAVAGASNDPAKYGNRVLKAYRRAGYAVYPINPKANEIEGLLAYPDVTSLPRPVHGLSIVTPPAVTVKVVDDAINAGIGHVWMQPGAESPAAVEKAEAAGLNVIANGPCVLVAMRRKSDRDERE